MYVCNDCGELFEEPIERTDDLGLPDEVRRGYVERYGVCPYCESEDFVEARICDVCGEYGKLYTGAHINYCKSCYEHTLKRFTDLLSDFSAEEKEILADAEVISSETV